MSMSLSGDNSRRSSQVPRGASVPRMAQSDDVLAQGIKDNFLFAAPDKNKRRGDKNAAAAAAERIMTQSAPTDVSASPVQPVSVMTSCSPQVFPQGTQANPQFAAQDFYNHSRAPHPNPPQHYASPQYALPSHAGAYPTPAMTTQMAYPPPPPTMHDSPAMYMGGYPPPGAMYQNQHGVPGNYPHANMPPSQWGAPMPPRYDSPTPPPAAPALHQQYIPAPAASRLSQSASSEPRVASPVTLSSAATPLRDHPASSPRLPDDAGHADRLPVSQLVYEGREFVNDPADLSLHDHSRSPETFAHEATTHTPSPVTMPSAVDSPRSPATGARQVTNDGFFIAFETEAPLKPRPKIGRSRNAEPTAPAKSSASATPHERHAAAKTSPSKPPSLINAHPSHHSPLQPPSASADSHLASAMSDSHLNDSLPGEAFVVGDFDDGEVRVRPKFFKVVHFLFSDICCVFRTRARLTRSGVA